LRDQEYIYCHQVGGGVGGNATTTPALPVGKRIAWTASVNTKSIDLIYKGKTDAVVKQVFGKPDKTQKDWLGYTGMNITNAKGEKYRTVWFGFANGIVQQVRFDR
jgi:hypothetical protein